MHHPRLILATTGQYIWEISKNSSYIVKSIGKSFCHYQNFVYFPSLGTAMHLSVLQFGKFLLFPLNFGSLAVKTVAFSEISSLFIIKSSVDHTSYKYCVLCMVKHKYFHYSPISWLIGIKSIGNYQNFVIFTCFIRSIMCYVYSNTKPILFYHWFGSLAVNAGAIIEISIISHQLSAI